jgi:hypothetical protein
LRTSTLPRGLDGRLQCLSTPEDDLSGKVSTTTVGGCPADGFGYFVLDGLELGVSALYQFGDGLSIAKLAP